MDVECLDKLYFLINLKIKIECVCAHVIVSLVPLFS